MVARTMYHWDDLDAGVPQEVNEWRCYGGPSMRTALRMLGMKIHGLTYEGAVLRGFLEVQLFPNGDFALHAMGRP
jgi:hypothetical protein